MAHTVGDFISTGIWTVLSAGVGVFGVYVVRNSNKVTSFFRDYGSQMFGRTYANLTYRRGVIIFFGVACVIFGAVSSIVGAVMLVRWSIGT